jgi:hypothetical protein
MHMSDSFWAAAQAAGRLLPLDEYFRAKSCSWASPVDCLQVVANAPIRTSLMIIRHARWRWTAGLLSGECSKLWIAACKLGNRHPSRLLHSLCSVSTSHTLYLAEHVSKLPKVRYASRGASVSTSCWQWTPIDKAPELVAAPVAGLPIPVYRYRGCAENLDETFSQLSSLNFESISCFDAATVACSSQGHINLWYFNSSHLVAFASKLLYPASRLELLAPQFK